MGAARGLDLLLGAVVAGGTSLRPAVALSSAALAAHTYAVTRGSRYETTGGSSLAPLAALATSVAISTGLGLRGFRGWGGADAGGGSAGSALAYRSDAPGAGGPARGNLQRARVRSLSLRAEDLTPVERAARQLTFDPADERARRIEAVADRARAKFGPRAVLPGSLAA
jgi:hypothetical protein